MSIESMDNVQSIHGLSGLCQWTLSSPPGLPGLCPWTMSRLSTESMDIVQSGWSHWTLSRVSIDVVQTVHWVHGKCPLSPRTMSRESTFYRRVLWWTVTLLRATCYFKDGCWWWIRIFSDGQLDQRVSQNSFGSGNKSKNQRWLLAVTFVNRLEQFFGEQN